MNPQPLLPPPSPASFRLPVARIIGVGGAGLQAVEHMVRAGLDGASYAVVHTDTRRLEASKIPAKLLLGARVTRGLKVGEPEMGRALAEADAHELRHLCEGADLVIVVAGLGGNTASGAAPVLARVARENGALVLALAALPFDFEGRRRQVQARAALQQLRAAADAVICLPNQKIAAILDDQTSLTEAMQIIDDLLAKGVRGLLRLLSREGLINVDFSDLCQVVRGRQAESCFATAEAEGENRAREVVERLARSPLLDAGQGLAQADALLVSLTGGPGLSLKDVNLVMEQINRAAERAQVIMGALIDPALGDRLAVTVVASRHLPAEAASAVPRGPAGSEPEAAVEPEPPAAEFPTGDVPERSTGRPGTLAGTSARRYVPPAPELSPEQAERLLGGRPGASAARRRGRAKPQQTALPLEVVSKGRFAKTEPTVHRGEDLDTPAYIRRGVALN
jgi:cell division protein FtsZ